jgi:subtilisin family serine protease
MNSKSAQDHGLDHIYVLEFDKSADIEALARRYAANPDIVYAEPDHIIRLNPSQSTSANQSVSLKTGISEESNDPQFRHQWALRNVRQVLPADGGRPEDRRPDGRPLPVGKVRNDINVEAAWGIETGSPNVVVGVLDSGVDTSHPEFAGRLTPGYDFIDGDTNANPVCVDGIKGCAHGTAVAGIIAAASDNGIGIAGVAPNVRIMPVRVLDEQGTGTASTTARGIRWATDNGADVINMSLGGGRSSVQQNAVEYAHGRNVVLVAAAGNENINNNERHEYPSDHEAVISAGALGPCGGRKRSSSDPSEVNLRDGIRPDPKGVTCDNEKWWGSNYGEGIHLIMAPGTRIYTTDVTGQKGYNTINRSSLLGPDYTSTFNGTSAAAPFVAGVAALVRSKYPSLTNEQVRGIMQISAVNIPFEGEDPETGEDPQTGFGRLDAYEALTDINFYSSRDLILEELTAQPRKIAEGRALDKIEFWIANRAHESQSGPWRVDYYLSEDRFVTTSDQRIGSFTIQDNANLEDIPQDTRREFQDPLPPTIPDGLSGTYYLGGILVGDDADLANNTTNGWNTQEIEIGRVKEIIVASDNPDAGINVSVTPPDFNGDTSGDTPFTRTYEIDDVVALRAPDEVDGKPFEHWLRDGVIYTEDPYTDFVTVDSDDAWVAVYGTPDLRVVQNSLSGTIVTEQATSQNLTLENPGTGTIRWSVSTADGADWLSPSRSEGIVRPGAREDVSLRFDASELGEGTYTETLVMTSNDLDEPEIRIPVSLEVIPSSPPAIILSSESISLAAPEGDASLETLTLSNAGGAPLYWEASATVTSGDETRIQLSVDPDTGTVAVGSDIDLAVSVRSLDAGEFDGTIEITSDDPDRSTVSVPVSITVTPAVLDVFVNLETDLSGIESSDVAWGDYDNDGDLDLLSSKGMLFQNDGTGSFSEVDVPFSLFFKGSASWGDYDNDGDLDALLTGEDDEIFEPRTALFRNDGDGRFTEVATTLQNVYNGEAAWGDYDNDGDLDVLIAGQDDAWVYRNEGNDTFVEIAANFDARFYRSADWGDYDTDGDLDILIGGQSVYRNDGEGQFSPVNTALPEVNLNDADWGDYDNDGDLDIAVLGINDSGDRVTQIYRNDGNDAFVDIEAGLAGVDQGALAWGDFNNDGRLDLFVAGLDADFNDIVHVYRNAGSDIFADIEASFENMFVSGAGTDWGDYDRDGDLDLVVAASPPRIYQNGIGTPNSAPAPPSRLSAQSMDDSVVLSWNSATDDETPVDGLTYNLRVGTAPGKADIVGGMSITEQDVGIRIVPKAGNAGHNLNWNIENLDTGIYYWSVQAVDPGFSGSTFAPEQVFGINTPIPVELTTFDAWHDGATVHLAWRTASETNNAGFEVQRRTEARERGSAGAWEQIGFVEGAGTTSNPQSYRFPDRTLPFEAEQLTYRLKQVDVGGAFEFSPEVEVTLGAPARLVLHAAFPNPVRDQATLRYELPDSGPVHLTVYNTLGQRVATLVRGEHGSGRHEISFDAEGFSSGLYFVQLQADGQALTRKLTVVR